MATYRCQCIRIILYCPVYRQWYNRPMYWNSFVYPYEHKWMTNATLVPFYKELVVVDLNTGYHFHYVWSIVKSLKCTSNFKHLPHIDSRYPNSFMYIPSNKIGKCYTHYF